MYIHNIKKCLPVSVDCLHLKNEKHQLIPTNPCIKLPDPAATGWAD